MNVYVCGIDNTAWHISIPVSCAGSLLLVTISVIILFNDKVSKVNLLGILLTLVAIVLINP